LHEVIVWRIMVHSGTVSIRSHGFSDIHDITQQVQSIIDDSGIQSGIASIFVPGSTASISTIEFEPALIEDMKEQLEKFASRDMKSRHSETWGDDNGFSYPRNFHGSGNDRSFFQWPFDAGDVAADCPDRS
jgi:thiamine phosphate synthase YjbQ (UPF0047 family)